MWRNACVASLLLTACNAWVRPSPPPNERRNTTEQRWAAVKIESYCDPFDDGTLGKYRVGSGVMVSSWQVLTALHVVDCQSALPTIRVYNQRGQRWKFVPEKEWVYSWLKERDGIARIQMASADDLSPKMAPPTVRERPWPDMDEVVFIQTPNQEKITHATGWTYGGAGYGGQVFTYEAGDEEPTEEGDSGSGEYDLAGDLMSIHLGHLDDERSYGALVQWEMVP